MTMPHHSISHQNTPDQTLVPWPAWPNLTYLYCMYLLLLLFSEVSTYLFFQIVLYLNIYLNDPVNHSILKLGCFEIVVWLSHLQT